MVGLDGRLSRGREKKWPMSTSDGVGCFELEQCIEHTGSDKSKREPGSNPVCLTGGAGITLKVCLYLDCYLSCKVTCDPLSKSFGVV